MLNAAGITAQPLAILGREAGPTRVESITLKPATVPYSPMACVKFTGAQGSIIVAGGDVFTSIGETAPAYPLEVEWELFAGLDECQLESVARTSTFLQPGNAPLVRGGSLFSEKFMATVFVLCGAVVNQPGVILTVALTALGLPASAGAIGPETSVGDLAG